MTLLDLPKVLSELATLRPVFHSEADFQHALAWQIHSMYAPLHPWIRLEHPCYPIGYVDIWVQMEGRVYAIELKYKKAELRGNVAGESFSFNDDSAHPLTRYDGFHDWMRVETACSKGADVGYAVFLTNSPTYWRREARGGSRIFSLHDGRVVNAGRLAWGIGGANYKKRRPHRLSIKGGGTLQWQHYSDPLGTEFKYLLYRYPKQASPVLTDETAAEVDSR